MKTDASNHGEPCFQPAALPEERKPAKGTALHYPSRDWHGKVLAERSEIIDFGKASWLSVDELQARLANR